MSLATNISNLATRIATEIKAVRALSGNLSSLDTTAKSNLVAALNELAGNLSTLTSNVSSFEGSTSSDISAINSAISGLQSDISALQSDLSTLDVSGQVLALIDDAATGTESVWSSSKTSSEISSAVAAVVDMAPTALDTLNELAAALGDDANYASTITSALAGKASATHSHSISDVSGLQTALDGKASASSLSTLSSNVGDTSTNFVTTFEAGLV